jgi:type I restriction enzyme M protein
VARDEIAGQGYDLSISRYKEVVHEQVAHKSPREILKDLSRIESEIECGLKQLEEMLG